MISKKILISLATLSSLQLTFISSISLANTPLVSLENLKVKQSLKLKPITQAPARPTIVGHRGACGHAPEHTLKSYQLAIDMGADFVETDIVVTKDGELIARHEYEIGETTNVGTFYPERKKIKTVDGVTKEGFYAEDFTYAELESKVRAVERLSYRNHDDDGKFKLVKTEDIIKLIKENEERLGKKIGFYPEIKHTTYLRSLGTAINCEIPTKHNCTVEEKLVELLHKHGYDKPNASPVVIQSFETANLIELRNILGPKSPYKLLQLLDEPQMQPGELIGKPGKTLTYNDMLSKPNLARIAKYADGVGPWKRMIVTEDPITHKLNQPNNIVDDAHEVGLFVHPYTFRTDKENLAPEYLNDPVMEYIQYFVLGVDGVFTDFADDGVKAREIYMKLNSPSQR